jgi:2,4-dienoyl-CoA reductase-like NADH-dependent reductase (Old Yellow Enzyme family)
MPGEPTLFDRVTIANCALPSRLIFAPINTGFARNGKPTMHLLRFHQRRSSPAVGINMVGNTSISVRSRSNTGTLVLASASDVGRFAVLARTIAAGGSVPGIQLGFSPHSLQPSLNWLSKDRPNEAARLANIACSPSDAELSSVLSAFVNSTRLSVQAGFRVIQINAAHGYLLSLLLNPLTNQRRGRFCLDGSWQSQFAEAVLEAAKGAVVSIRLSVRSGLPDTNHQELPCLIEASKTLSRSGVHILDYSNGFYTVDRRMIYPGIEKGILPNYITVQDLAREVDCFVAVSGNIDDCRKVPKPNERVLFSVGRALIADPEFAIKSKLGQHDSIIRCRRTGRCHYFSRGARALECGANPEVARSIAL